MGRKTLNSIIAGERSKLPNPRDGVEILWENISDHYTYPLVTMKVQNNCTHLKIGHAGDCEVLWRRRRVNPGPVGLLPNPDKESWQPRNQQSEEVTELSTRPISEEGKCEAL